MKRWATTSLLLLAGAIFLIGGLPHSAQAQATTAAITGTVVDENEEPLPGVNIVAVHEPTGTQYGAATNPNGQFNIRGMRVGGPYTVTASFVGYQTTRREDIRLQLDETREINFSLQQQTAELEEVEVVSRQDLVFDSDRTGAATNISEEEIEGLPTIDRSLSDLARLLPQSTGGNSLAGRNARYNNIQIDGATLNDVFGLGEAVPGSQADAQPISLDAIQEFNVELAPYDVRDNGFTGGQINAITKSGTNEFSGSLRVLGRNQDLVGTLGENEVGDFGEYYYVGTLGGPIIEDELFFFVTGELVREGVPRNARVGTDIDQPNAFREDPDLFEQIQDISINQYGYDPGGYSPLTERTDNDKFLAKLDWNINDSHRLTARHNYVGASDDSGLSRGTNSFDFSSRQYTFRSVQNSTTLELNSTLGSNLFNEARAVYTRIRDSRNIGDDVFPHVTVNLGNRSIGLGVGQYEHANRLDQDLVEITNNLTYETGDHSITVGTSNQIFSFSNLFLRDFYGTYEFQSFETPAGEELSALEAYERGQPTSYSLSYATDAAGTDRPEAEFTAFQLGGYVQDEWDALENLTLTAGLRLDVPVLPQEPSENPDVEEAFGRNTSEVASGNLLWAPRLGVNYNRDLLSEDFDTQIRGGVGFFNGSPPFVWISNQYSNTGVDVNRINAGFDPGDDFYEGENDNTGSRFFSSDPNDQPRPSPDNALEPEETTEVNLTDNDFTYPQTLRTNVAIDQEMPLGFSATLEGTFSKTLNDIAYENLNLERNGTSQYGRPLYGVPQEFADPSDQNRVDEQFTDVLLLTNTSEGYEYTLTAQIQRQTPTGLNGSLAYTFNRAESVNSGTSSQAVSNWRFNPSIDINNSQRGIAAFERRHRILANLTYRFEYADRFATSIGVVYDGSSGSPFSWIYFGDANGDGTNNDLLYVPESEEDIFLTSDNWNHLDAFIRGRPALQDARGSFIDRNTARDPWTNIVDLKLTQEIATFRGQRVELTANLENVLNFLNNEWGRIRTSSFNEQTAWNFEGYVEEGDVGTEMAGRVVTEDDIGKPIVNAPDEFLFEPALAEEIFGTSFASRWRLQFGVRYTF